MLGKQSKSMIENVSTSDAASITTVIEHTLCGGSFALILI